MIFNFRKLFQRVMILLLLLSVLHSNAQTRIDRSKDEVNDKKGNSGFRSSNNDDSDSDDLSFFEVIFTEFFVEAFLYVTYYSAIGDFKSEKHLHKNLTDHPYSIPTVGNFISPDSLNPQINYFRLDLEDQLLLGQNRLIGNYFKAKIRPFQYFYFQTDLYSLREYNRMEQKYSYLSLFNLDFCYDRLRFDRFNLGWTFGMNYIGNGVNRAGIAFGLNTDIFIAKPISMYAAAKWGSINHTPVNEFEIKWKCHVKNYFASVGYNFLKIGTPKYNFFGLGGGVYLF